MVARESASEGTVLRAEFSRKFPMQNCARESSDEFRKRRDGEEAALSGFNLNEDDFQLPCRLRTLHVPFPIVLLILLFLWYRLCFILLELKKSFAKSNKYKAMANECVG